MPRNRDSRLSSIVILMVLLSLCACCIAPSVRIEKDVMIPMRDGVELAANISRPDSQSSFPVIIVRTPYDKDNEEDGDWGEYWAEQGYVFVLQDCRGTGNSTGEWYPAIHERADGVDTREWVLKQPWCNGSIGTTGGSYLGFTQFAASLDSTTAIKAMFPEIALMDWYDGVTYIDGALSIGTVMNWGLEMAEPSMGEGIHVNWEESDQDRVFRTLPLIDFDKNVGMRLPWMRDWILNPSYNEYWAPLNIDSLKTQCETPLIAVSGWYDIFMHQALEYQAHAIENGKQDQHLIIGPWAHGPNWVEGERELGENHELDFDSIQMSWFGKWLKGEEWKEELAPIKLYVMGSNVWRNEQEWPLARTQYTNYYLHSDGSANTARGNGRLSLSTPGDEPQDQFQYEPHDPVPTLGGSLLFGEPGPMDQEDIEKRHDVLVYTSEVLKEPLEVTGPVKLILHASSDSRDTDWTGKLVDVYPDGRAFNLCDGVIRARYRHGPSNPELITPDKVYRYEIDLWATSNVFLPGHRIRVEISSSNFPRFDRNPNTGNTFGMDADIRTAEQTVYHDKLYPSYILLPVIG